VRVELLVNWTESEEVGAPDPAGEQLQFDAVLKVAPLLRAFQVQTLAEALALKTVSARLTVQANNRGA
jgi:hypothetical protein